MMSQKGDLLRQKILRQIKHLQDVHDHPSKDAFRLLHKPAVQMALERSRPWVKQKYPQYEHFFADGSDVIPEQVQPKLIEVKEQWQRDLFRLARYTWALPFTKGFGRRLQFLIMDEANQKLIGVLGLQSPPLDLPARDCLFDYPEGRKVELINQTMDIYTLGAVPPYGRLLGGKLVALAARAVEVRQAYTKKYQGRLTEMDQTSLPARLVALTSTSAFGRSSLYNRLKFRGQWVAEPIGFTEGYGSVHLQKLYPLMREFLEAEGVSTRGGFGNGPKIVWQTCSRTFDHLGLPRHLLKHGIRREVFLFGLTCNLTEFMNGAHAKPIYHQESFQELSDCWKERWLLPRATRVSDWKEWDNQEIKNVLGLSQ
jgi:hypothetical protein